MCFSLAMVAIPALTMLACYHVVFARVVPLDSAGARMTAAGIAAVGSVQVVIAAFLYHAFFGEDAEARRQQAHELRPEAQDMRNQPLHMQVPHLCLLSSRRSQYLQAVTVTRCGCGPPSFMIHIH